MGFSVKIKEFNRIVCKFHLQCVTAWAVFPLDLDTVPKSCEFITRTSSILIINHMCFLFYCELSEFGTAHKPLSK